MTLEEHVANLRRTIADFGRPPLGIAAESLQARREWDLADHARCDRYWAAVDALNQTLDELERRNAIANADRRIKSALGRCGAPERLWALSLAPDETPALASVREWVSGSSPVLVLAGGIGTGKTVASLWGLRQLAHRHLRPEYVRAAEMARFGRYGPEADARLSAMSAGVLVLDDLGTEAISASVAEIFGELVDSRYAESCLRTIITTNLTWPDIESRYGERASDRLREGAIVAGTGMGSMRRESRKAGQPGAFLGIPGGGS